VTDPMPDNPAPRRVSSWFQKANSQFLRFAAAGAAGTLLHYLVLVVLVSMLGAAPGPAASAGAVAGACVNYWLNRRYTFQSTRRHSETVPLFIAMAALGAVLNGLIVAKLASVAMNFLLAQLFATMFILGLNFLISKKWIFQKHK
jgi:putative flippase GtrA